MARRTRHQEHDGAKPEFNTLELEIVEAKHLMASDTGVLQSGKSDPYVVVKATKGMIMSGGDHRSLVCKSTLNPKWHHKFVTNFSYKLTSIKFELFDSDEDNVVDMDGDDLIGKAEIVIEDLCGKAPLGETIELDTWLPLTKATSGKLHVRAKVTFHIPVAMPGTRVPLPPFFQLGLAWDFSKKDTPVDLDAAIFGLDCYEEMVGLVGAKSGLVGFGGAIRHSGDDRGGLGEGDDETITVNLQELPANVEKLAVCINSFTLEPLSKVKSAYLRIVVNGHTHAFFRLGKGRVPDCTGLLFGVMQRSASGVWEFIATAVEANGRHVNESRPAIIRYGKAHLGW